jgi:hypothetical protein
MAPPRPAAPPDIPTVPVPAAPVAPKAEVGLKVAPAPAPKAAPVVATPAPAPAVAAPPTDALCGVTCALVCLPADPGLAWYGSADYLFYFLKPAPVAVPLATTGPAAGRGILGNPAGAGAVVLGNSTTDYGMFSGMRATLGAWVNPDRTVAVEGSAFFTEARADRVRVAGGPGGLPVLARPFFDTTTGTNNVRLLALPGSFTGSVVQETTAQLWGAEALGVFRAAQSDGLTVDALTGFRFLSLEESLRVTDVSAVLANGTTAFNAGGFAAGTGTQVSDFFSTQNRFYGGTLGARVGYSSGDYFVALTGKVALGSVHQVVTLDGTTTLAGGGPLPATVGGGLYNLAPNAGRYTKDDFAVVPEVGLKVGARLTPRLSVTAGYDFIYLSRAVRPGEQVNQTVNPTFLPTSPTLGVPFGPRQPGFTFHQTDFYAHGATVGLAFTY